MRKMKGILLNRKTTPTAGNIPAPVSKMPKQPPTVMAKVSKAVPINPSPKKQMKGAGKY